MKFIGLYTFDPATRTGPPDETEMEKMGALIADMRAAGAMLDTGGVIPTGMSMRLQRKGAEITITDGPFTEAKEIVGGFAVMECGSRDELVKWMTRFMECAGEGTSEVIEVTSLL